MSLTLVQQTPLSDISTYSLMQCQPGNTAGNMLVAYVGLGSVNPSGTVPRFTISDDAHNWWDFAGTSYANVNPGVGFGQVIRVDVWVCMNARACTTVSVTASGSTAGMVGTVAELSGAPQYFSLDYVQTATGSNDTLTVSATQPGASDYTLAAVLVGSNLSGNSFSVTPSGMTALTTVGNGGVTGDVTALQMSAAVGTTTHAAGAVSATWTWVQNTPYTAVVLGISASPSAPAQPNPNWPSVKVEAAFGYQPGNLTGAMPAWTDVTSRAIGPDGDTLLNATRGRDYELAQPQAGDITLGLVNNDGAFDPLNSSSPYAPNVTLETPVRVSAFWNGHRYGVCNGYVNAWPQDFPDPQWGVSTLRASDAIGLASQGQMPTALGGDYLADNAYAYWPFGEFYDLPDGLPFNNQARFNQKPMIGYSPSWLPTRYQLQTGLQMGIAGDPGTGVGFQVTPAQSDSVVGSGALCRDPALPQLANGVTVELWAVMPPNANTSSPDSQYSTLLVIGGMPANFWPTLSTTSPWPLNGGRLLIGQTIPPNTLMVDIVTTLQDPTGAVIASPSVQVAAAGQLVQILVQVYEVAGTWTISTCVNDPTSLTAPGTFTQASGANANTLDCSYVQVGPVPLYSQIYGSTWQAAQVAIFPWLVPTTRLLSHYSTGMLAANGDTIATRIARLFTWAQMGLPFGAALSSLTPLMGNADQVQGTALADQLYVATVNEGGMFYVPASAVGEIWYATRESLYNKPAKYTFGDNGTTETPFLPGAGFDYSDTYVYNIVSSQRTISAGEGYFTQVGVPGGALQVYQNYGADALVADQASEEQFLPRGPLQQDIETSSDEDAYDRANWSLAKYRNPQLRPDQIQIDCAANPSAFAVALAVEQGDVVQVNRRPVGWVNPLSVLCIVQQVKHEVGPNQWDVTLTLAPYFPENSVLQLDNTSYNEVGFGALGW